MDEKLSHREGVAVFEILTNRYDAWFESDKGKILFENEVKAIKYALDEIEVGESLEIGVGTGRFAKALGIKIGLDPAINALKIAKERGIIPIQGIAENLPFVDNIFDTVFIIVTICFVENPRKTLQEAWRVLKPEKMLILGFIDKNSVWGLEYLEKKKKGHAFYKPAKFYSYKEIIDLLKNSNFKPIKTVSTLIDSKPNRPILEKPKIGYIENAGFKVIVAKTQK